MQTQTNTNGVDFVYNNLQAGLQSNLNANTNSTGALPQLLALDAQSALALTGRQPGGTSYKKGPATATPNSTDAAILLAGWESRLSQLGFTKNGAFLVSLSGTNAVTVPLTNTATNTNAQAGDTVFAQWSQIVLFNLSGLDGNNSASMTVTSSNTNGANIGVTPVNASGGLTIQGASSIVITNNNGQTINAANANIIITPTANSTFGMCIGGQ